MVVTSNPLYSPGLLFSPGQIVPHPGIYGVMHAKPHPDEYREIFVDAGKFRECLTCNRAVRFRLVAPVPHIDDDPDFNQIAKH